MPYTVDNPPEAVKGLPKHAIEIFVASFNSAFEQYDGDEGKANAVAWAAVKTKYKKKDDKWVAKESDKAILQSKYSLIIQEVGKRNAAIDATRIKKIVELCQELLSSEVEDEEKTKEAIKEAESVLAWLKEQQAMKTEDGEQYPAEAFAYVPDAEKPSAWKLRLWEDPQKRVTRAQLGRAAAALSPGGFRGQKAEILKEDLSAVKRKIRAEYRKLDVDDEDIPKWVKESEERHIYYDYTPLKEATIGARGIARVIVIKPGFGNPNDNHYYPAETLARDYSVFEGVKMHADHQTEEEERQRPEGSIRQWVANLKNVRFEEGVGIVGDAVIVEGWLQAKLAMLRDNDLLNEMGISIRAAGVGTKGKIDGKETKVVERITRVRSVDFVTEAGAGGRVLLYEANSDEYDIDVVSLETLRERRPDLVKNIETKVKAVIMQEVKHKVELEEQIKEKDAIITNLTQERDELKSKLTEADKAKVKAEAQAKIKEAVDKAELPDAARTKLLERFDNADTADGITEAIKAEADYIAALKEAGKPRNMGDNQPGFQVTKDQLKESFMRLGMSEKEAEIAVTGR